MNARRIACCLVAWLVVAGCSSHGKSDVAPASGSSASKTDVAPAQGSSASKTEAAPAQGSSATSATPAITGDTLLSWGGANRFGSDLLTIDARGAARFEFRDARGTVTRGGPLKLTARELRDLEALLAKHAVCALRSAPGYLPVPEETRTTLAVQFGTVSCAVELYANEWRAQAAAKPISAAIEAISLRIQKSR